MPYDTQQKNEVIAATIDEFFCEVACGIFLSRIPFFIAITGIKAGWVDIFSINNETKGLQQAINKIDNKRELE